MTLKTNEDALFISALKEAVRQYPGYFYLTQPLEQVVSMWDLQPQYSRLEELMLEDQPTQQFVTAVWSFYRPISLGQSALAEITRSMHPWQKAIIGQLIIYDPIGRDNPDDSQPSMNAKVPDFSADDT
ncbi:MAG: hypothetical protein MI976_10275 [Pseudomonadales bacterium]|nr:hypothetical protein [Pseudomonadales bacterium]